MSPGLRSVLHRSCTAPHSGRIGSTVDDLSVNDLCVDGISVNDPSVDGPSENDLPVDGIYVDDICRKTIGR